MSEKPEALADRLDDVRMNLIERLADENERLMTRLVEAKDKALRYDLDAAGISNREKEALELVELRAENERLRRDAERYRWLKAKVEDYDGHACFPQVPYPAPIPDCSPFDAVDAAIDASMGDKT